ncbi:branched-chain amino acid aminotransferase [Aristophania vespae]|uniref:Probable branched-chain-amino-acid aminotransferase n=1 Tax=Aristophania vespae TaxID=2697033 RepID=A0A6P1N9K7_9PROT|nr:branched-chain amino acid aminotransferase [Aristophania vespae]QHI95096.1 branched-chain amino acid aminotransferase [Aristophania vespae]
MTQFTFEKTPNPISQERRQALLQDPKFGRVFTDHMAVIRYNDEKGWHDAKVTPRQPLPIDPASTVLHYGQEIFEGLKAYRGEDGRPLLFRPQANAARFAASARRLAMAELPENLFLGAIEALLKLDHEWIPSGEGQSLYLRPFMIANEVFLGVKPATEYLFVLLACPVGAYFGSGCVPVWVTETYSRAAPGGTGEAKCGGNYAASLVAQMEAKEKGCEQVLFLDAVEKRYIDEMGGMNVMFVRRDGTVVTPPLSGTILRGITRDSLLKLGRHLGISMVEEKLSIDDVFAQAQSGEITEAFACGTAAVISPIGVLKRPSAIAQFGDGKNPGPVTLRLREALTTLQRGQSEDPFGWRYSVTL